MTVAPDAPALRFTTLAEAIAQLREHGRRLSTARRLILEALFAADGPVAAPYLVDALSLEESSVYRNLEVLESHGLVRHVHLGHGPGLYALLGGDEVEYLYCERCAEVTTVTPDRLTPMRDAVRQEFGYEPRFTHFALVGLCADCATQPHRTTAPDSGVESGGLDSHTHDHAHSHGGYVHSHSPPRADGRTVQRSRGRA
jgi:Fur family ferric uptake transcriptional regulator